MLRRLKAFSPEGFSDLLTQNAENSGIPLHTEFYDGHSDLVRRGRPPFVALVEREPLPLLWKWAIEKRFAEDPLFSMENLHEGKFTINILDSLNKI